MENLPSLRGTRVLVVGYNGANNTGAEALLQADIEDLRAVLGPEAHITVPTLNQANLRRYLVESPSLRIAPLPSLYFGAIHALVKESDLVLLVEGSTYMDTWGSALLWAFLWATACAAALGKPSLAYAVDSGTLSPANRRRVRRIASRTNLIVTRSEAAAERLRAMGVRAPMRSTADNALTFIAREGDSGWARRDWPEAGEGIVGLSVVDFYLWPVRMRLWGRKENRYKWPYYFSTSKARTRATEALAAGFAALADRVIASTGKAVALICMEQVDERLAAMVLARMAKAGKARVFSARQYDASKMSCLLRGLDLLVTSRFHAAILSLEAGVPQVALGHDLRLATLYRDLGLEGEWFLKAGNAETFGEAGEAARLFAELGERLDRLLLGSETQRQALASGYATLLEKARRNRTLLADFVAEHFPQQARRAAADLGNLRARAPDSGGEGEGGSAWVA